MALRSFWLILGTLALVGTAEAQTVVKREPPAGGMRRGEILYVDDGSCPSGQIKMVTAGTMGSATRSARGANTSRTRTCVARR